MAHPRLGPTSEREPGRRAKKISANPDCAVRTPQGANFSCGPSSGGGAFLRKHLGPPGYCAEQLWSDKDPLQLRGGGVTTLVGHRPRQLPKGPLTENFRPAFGRSFHNFLEMAVTGNDAGPLRSDRPPDNFPFPIDN